VKENQLKVPVDSVQVKQEAMQDTGRGFFPALCALNHEAHEGEDTKSTKRRKWGQVSIFNITIKSGMSHLLNVET